VLNGTKAVLADMSARGKLPPHICIRDIAVTPTRTAF